MPYATAESHSLIFVCCLFVFSAVLVKITLIYNSKLPLFIVSFANADTPSSRNNGMKYNQSNRVIKVRKSVNYVVAARHKANKSYNRPIV